MRKRIKLHPELNGYKNHFRLNNFIIGMIFVAIIWLFIVLIGNS